MKMSSMARMGSSGNTKLLSKYGGKHRDKPYKFANGGAVPGLKPAQRKAYADGGPIDGMPARARLDRKGGKAKPKSKTTVNVVVAGKGDGAPAMPPAPMAGPPMPPPGPGGPPMPMRKHGGAVQRFARGGKVRKRADGGWTGEGDTGQHLRDKADAAKGRTTSSGVATGVMSGLRAASRMAPRPLRALLNAGIGEGALSTAVNAKEARSAAEEAEKAEGRKDGGRINSDAAEDKKMAASMVHKHERDMHHAKKLTKFAKGGRVKFDAGAGSGEGREEKAEAVERRRK